MLALEVFALLVPFLAKLRDWLKSLNCLYTCLSSEIICMFCSTSYSYWRRTYETSDYFQFSISVFLLVADMSYCWRAKLLTWNFLSVSMSSLIPFSQSQAVTVTFSSSSINFIKSSCCFVVPKCVVIRLKGAIFCSIMFFQFCRSGLKTMSVDKSIPVMLASWSD